MEVLTKSHKNEKKEKQQNVILLIKTQWNRMLPSFVFQDNSCIHPHAKQYAV
jgi:hypothetical protein